MIAGPPEAPLPLAGLVTWLAVLLAQRAAELVLSARNERRLAARGGREHAAGHFPFLVLVHVLLPLLLVAEVLALGARPGALWLLWLGVWLAAQALRYAAVSALGERWTVRIWVLPGAPLVRRGPYRFVRHPNYLAVILELAAAPLLFGAWRTALVVSAVNAAALAVRVRAEERALGA